MRQRAVPLRQLRTSRRRFVQGSIAIASCLPALRPAVAQGGQVNVYNFDTYIGEDTLAEFTDATGIEVRYDLYGSTDEMFAKLRAGNPGYDVVVPTNNYVERMRAADMLVALDHSKLPNLKNIDPAFQNPAFDPGRKHSVPYFWGTQGIGYRISAVEDQPPKSWGELLASDRFSGRIAVLGSIDAIDNTLKYLGYSLNDSDPARINEAAEVLIKAKPHIKAFHPDTGQDLLISGEVDLVMEWNGDILQVMAEDDDLAYVVPDEGSLLWEDTLAIPTGGPNPDNAHAFINYILDGAVHGAIASEIKYPCPNAAAMAYIPEEDRENPAIYPTREVLERCETQVYDMERDALKEEALTRILAA
jgi:spermidine/putrescine transport system substrate-binding protein